jgi:phage replication-related protein YjqB (UPF0714/DUF867 family)
MPHDKQKYLTFSELKKREKEGSDYQIHFRLGKSGIAVMAPHGGGIEPGTTEIADALAGHVHSFYSFEGIKRCRNLELHITSKHFDETLGITIAQNSETIVAIHGCKGDERAVYLGGRDLPLIERVKKSLKNADFLVKESPRFPGMSPWNICNRSQFCKGVQLEISAGLRRLMFEDLPRLERKRITKVFVNFVFALKGALALR